MNNKKPEKSIRSWRDSAGKDGELHCESSVRNIGAHSIFLGQIRADEIDGKTVSAIDYSAYEEMAKMFFMRSGKLPFRNLTLPARIFIIAWVK